MHDILPADTPLWRSLERTVAEVFSAYGYEEIRVPLVEKTEVFARAIGESTDVVEKEMYSFADRSGDMLSLRPEGTAGVVRAALQNGLLRGPPVRLWYGGPMFRYERPQKGRTRQFHQMGAEIFGAEGPDVDAELIAMGERLWRRLGVTGIRLELNSLGNRAERDAYRAQLVCYLRERSGELDDETLERLERNPLRVLDSKDQNVRTVLAGAPVMTDFLGDGTRRHFDGVLELLDRLGIEYRTNPLLVRGLDYYSHTVFEWITGELGAQGTICAGGRYDDLVAMQGGQPCPAIGFAMGLERLVELRGAKGVLESESPHAYLVMAGQGTKETGLALAEKLRDELPGLRLVCNAGTGSFKSQFRRADRSGAGLALVLGDEELAKGSVVVKQLREDRPQESVAVQQLPQWLASWLGERER
jgi:histidyl-tRNA synthetase